MSELRTALVIAGRVDPSLGRAVATAGATLDQAGEQATKVVGQTTQALGRQAGAADHAAKASGGLGQALRQEAAAGGQAAQVAGGVGQALTRQTAATVQAGSAASGLGQALRQEAAAGGQVAQVAGGVGQALTRQTAATVQAGGAASGLGQALRRVEAEGRRGERVVRTMAQAGRQADTAMGGAARSTNQAGNALRKFAAERAEAMSGGGLGIGDLVSSAAVAGAGRGAVRSALSFETAQVRLGTVVNAEDANAAVGNARRSAIDYARQNLTGQVEHINIQYALNSAGLDAGTSRLGASVVAEVATVTDGLPEQVGEVIATVYNNLGHTLEGEGAEKLARIGDVLTKTQFKFPIRNFAQLGESFANAASAMARANVPLEQGATLLGILNGAGMQGAVAGTGFTAVTRQLTKAQEELGIEIVRTADGQMDYIATLESIDEALAVYDDLDERNAVIQEIFGDEGAKALTPMLLGLKDLRAQVADVTEGSRGLRSQSYEDFLKSTPGQLKVLGNNLQIVGLVIAGTFLPAVNAAVGPLVTMLTVVGKLVEEFPVLGQAISGVAAAFLLFKTVAIARGVGGLLLGGLGGLSGRRGGGAAGARPGGGAAGLLGRVAGGAMPVMVVNWPGGLGLGAMAGGAGGVGGVGGGAGGVGGVGGAAGKAGGAVAAGGKVGMLAKAGGMLKGGLGMAGRALPWIAAGAAALQFSEAAAQGDAKGMGGAAGGLGGSLAGAAAGAALGSMVPVIGTAIGGLIGGAVGYFGGDFLGQAIGGLFADDDEALDEKAEVSADQAYADEQTARVQAGGATAAAAAPAVVMAELSADRAVAGPVTTTNTYNTTVHTAASDPAEVARQITREQRAAARGALHD